MYRALSSSNLINDYFRDIKLLFLIETAPKERYFGHLIGSSSISGTERGGGGGGRFLTAYVSISIVLVTIMVRY